MKKFSVAFLTVIFAFSITACSGLNNDNLSQAETNIPKKQEGAVQVPYDEDFDLKAMIENMSLKEKAGQMIMTAFRTDAEGENITVISQEIQNTINEYNLCGIVVFGENIQSTEQLKKFISDAKAAGKTPVFVGIDEEGGRVSRIAASGIAEGYNPSSPQKMAENGSVYEEYSYIAKTLKEFGINLDFAPVCDINTNPENIVIGDRAFGSDAEKSAQCVKQAVRALKDGGVASVLKHFPGHGDTKEDSHDGAATASYDHETFISREGVPFKEGMAAGGDMVMVGHILTPNLSENSLPACMNPDIVTGILREEFGFEGAVITDALDMGAISEYYSPEEAAVEAIRAGCDILLMPQSVEETVNAIVSAVESGELSEKRIDESLLRILRIKKELGILQ